MSSISALNSLPPISGTPTSHATTTQGTSSASSSTSTDSVDSLGTTFLSMLVQELQNQDPTQPMDSTAMVGQMISLNQLDQLASINQLLSNEFGSATSTTNANQGTVAAQLAYNSTSAALQAALQSQTNSSPSTVAASSASLSAF